MKNFYRRGMLIIMFLLAMGFLVMLAMSQAKAATPINHPISLQNQVRGTVSDQNGEPLLGVTILVKNTQYGTTTNPFGEYELSASPEDTLVFSFVGYKTQQIPIKGRGQVQVQLVEGIASLHEVEINAGYYSVKEREWTGNISRVTAEEIENQPVVSPLQALQGRMAGVEIIPGGNQPGTASTIRIRGINSLREEGNYPLYIIDGVPVNSSPFDTFSEIGGAGIDPLNTLNLSNIESIEVLKDADATAIYGSRGANGVVLITTKKPLEGKVQLTGRVYTGVLEVPNRVDVLNTQQYLQVRRRAFENDGVEPNENNAFDLLLWDQDRYTDWQDFLFGGTAQVNNVDLMTTGGNENTGFRIGGSYYTQGTVYPGDYNYRKVTGSFNLHHNSQNRKLQLDLSVNYGVDDNDLVGDISIGRNAFVLPPNAPSIFLEDGSLNWEDWAFAGWSNPLEGFYNSSTTNSNNLISGLAASYRLFNGGKLKLNAGYTHLNSNELIKMPRRSYNPSSWQNIDHASLHLQNIQKSWILEPQFIYERKIENLKMDALVGTTFQEREFEKVSFQGKGYVSEGLIGNLSAAEDILNGSSQYTTYRYNALFGRLGLNWDRKYYLNLTGRRDGSSRFGPGKQWANFWAIGGSWIFTEEGFLDGDEILSFGKLRTSYGTTGNDQIGDYGYLDAYQATPGAGGLYPTQLANSDYSWEVNKKLEAALELSLFKNRFDLGLSWYRNRSSNQLVGYPLPSITGFTTIQANLPATVENTGWELEVSSRNIQSDDFHWQSSMNISFPKNELVSYPRLDQSSYANTYRVGFPLNISLLYQYEGIDPETGYYSVQDVNEDGSYDFEDRIVIQDWGRKFFGGINNNLRYKNFSLQFLWQFVKQEGSFDLLNAGDIGVQGVEVMKVLDGGSRFQSLSQSTEARIAYSRAMSTVFPIVDASFLRLKNISLGYSIPQKTIQKLGLEEARIFFNGQNLITITGYKGLDPERPIGGTTFAGLRTLTGGLQLQF